VPIENSLSFLGLQTSPNNLGAGEKGALVVADNVTIRYPDVLEPRRGQASTGIYLPNPAAVTQTFFFEDKVFVHTAAEKVQRLDTGIELTGDYVAADPDYRLKTAIAASTLYMATDKGVMALEEATSTVPRLSGIAEPLKAATDVVLDTGSTTIPGFLLPEKAVAYRILFGYVDSHGALHLGPPSVKFTVKNVSTTTQASVKVTVSLLTAPTDVTGAIVSGTFVRLYRSVMADTEGATSGELYLVNETVIDASAYTTDDVLSIADTARQEFAVQSAPLYTNATQGFLPNDPPPFARDIATWSEREWYANTEQPYELTAQLIGVEGGGTPDVPTTGIRIGDTINIAGVTFTAASSNNVYTPAFRVVSSGTPESNISETLDNLAEIVNGYARFNPTTFKIRAYLEPVVFGTDQLNFKIRFQRPSVDSSVNTAFGVDYSVQQFTGVVVAAKVAGEQTVTTLVANQWKVDDFVQFRSTNPTLPRITALVTTVVSPTVVRVTPVTVDVPTGYTLAYRLYGESVWTPDLSAGVAADNERRQNGLYYSLPDEPEAVSAANYLTVGTSGKAIRRIIPQRDRLLVFKDEGTYAVYGDFPYQVTLVDDTVAILAPDSATAIGSTVIVLTEDGIMAVSDGGIRMISRPIDSTLKPYGAANYRATTATGAFGVAYESEKVFALFMPSLSITDYTAKAYVYGLETDAWTTWSYPAARLCGRIDPFSDTAYYGLAASPYLVKDKNTSSTGDYFDYNEAITSTVQWAATTLGAPYATKHAREIHFHYRDVRQTDGATVTADYSLKTDILPAGQTVLAWPAGSTFSMATTIGPAVLPLQYRKLVPQEVQRATYYTLGLVATTSSPGGYWALNGYSIVFEGTSERTGTVR
jgi:hypothetical protein